MFTKGLAGGGVSGAGVLGRILGTKVGRAWPGPPEMRSFYNEGGKTLAEVAWRGGGCSIPDNIQGQSSLIWLEMSLLVAWVGPDDL